MNEDDTVIRELYAATVNPIRLSEYEALWEAYIDAQIQRNPVSFDFNNTPIIAHLNIAMDILGKVRVANEGKTQVQDIIESHYGFGFIIDKNGRIISSNADASDFTSGHQNLSDLNINQMSVKNILDWLNKKDRRYSFFQVHRNDAPSSETWFVSSIVIDRDSPGTSHQHFLITSSETSLSSESRNVIGESLGLSTAETQVAGLLAAGKTPKEVAALRDVKITAVRTQIVNIKNKMNANDIPDIVRKFISMGLRATSAMSQIKRTEDVGSLNSVTVRETSITLRDGRRMQCFEQGHPNGQIILQLHSLISGVEFTEKASQDLVRHGYRMISPCRAGFGKSDLNRQKDTINVIDESVKDLVEVLDSINANNVVLLTGWAGAIAQRLALKDARIKGLVLSGAVPVWSPEYVNVLSPRYRTLIKTSIHAPKAAPYLARLGKALIDSGRSDLFIGSLDKMNRVDQLALKDKDVYRLVEDRFKFLTQQGIWAFSEDLPSIHQDWTEDAKQLKIPVTIVLGEDNTDQPPEAVMRYKNAVPSSKIVYIEGAGTYQNLTHFEDVFKVIRSMNDHKKP
ncbi:MAG: alpha/beta fold hydrolase [Hellea sp.]